MPPRPYTTVADELVEHADATAEYFVNLGYTVRIEWAELGFPYTPTFVCKRGRTTVIVEVAKTITVDRLRNWQAYARSSGRDTRVAISLPSNSAVTPDEEASLRSEGMGLYRSVAGTLQEGIPPRDLALNLQLPDIASLDPRSRKLMGSAYEQFNRSQWREGFEDACQTFESEARRYLLAGIRSGRITLLGKGGPKHLTAKQVNKLTMGQLASLFPQIQNQNYADAIIGKTLKTINRDRIGVAHHKGRAATEARLRRNVGRHMWTLVAAMKRFA